MDIDYDGSTLRIGEQTHELRHDIKDYIVTADTIVVLIHPDEGGAVDPQNVLGFDTAGNKVWEVEIPSSRAKRHMFNSIAEKGGEILGQGWNRHRYRIDIETGDIENLGRTRK